MLWMNKNRKEDKRKDGIEQRERRRLRGREPSTVTIPFPHMATLLKAGSATEPRLGGIYRSCIIQVG